MLKIGDFSLLGRVSQKALRIYDDMDLLKPARVDPATQYRYYTAPQLERLRAIRGLLALGFRLEEIGPVLAGELAGEVLAELAGRKLAEAERLRAELGERAAALERLRVAVLGGEPLSVAFGAGAAPRWAEVPSRWIASVKAIVPEYSAAGALVGALYAALGSGTLAGAHPAGPPSCIYHDAEYRERDASVEVFLPVDFKGEPPSGPPRRATGEVSLRILEAATGFAVEHRGPYETLGDGYSAIAAVIDAAGLRPSGPPREEWIKGPSDTTRMDELLTNIFIPCRE